MNSVALAFIVIAKQMLGAQEGTRTPTPRSAST